MSGEEPPSVVGMARLRQWVSPTDRPNSTRGGVTKPSETAGTVLDILLSSRFRKGSLDSAARRVFVARHLGLLTDRVDQGRPVQLTLIGFPFKVPNPLKVGERALPDLAEVAALKKLSTLHRAVQAVYLPGVEIVIIHDGTYIAEALDVPLEEARAYAAYFGQLVQGTGADAFIRCEDLAELIRTHRAQTGAPTTRSLPPFAIEPPPSTAGAAFRKTLGMLNIRSLPTSLLMPTYRAALGGDPASLTGAAATLHERGWRAMQRYCFLDFFLHRFDPRPHAFPEAIHVTTRAQQQRLALWLVNRGKSVLPWHGVGVLGDEDRVDVRYVMDIEDTDAYRPVFLHGESTPFFYESTTRSTHADAHPETPLGLSAV